MFVAPLAGAWIEIAEEKGKKYDGLYVAPLAGAWIEIVGKVDIVGHEPSLPSRERGLK